jgi:hypothetical protein
MRRPPRLLSRLLLLPAVSLLLLLLAQAGAVDVVGMPYGSTWAYKADGVDLSATSWTTQSTASWASGPAPVGFGAAQLTVLPAGFVTYYLRHSVYLAEVNVTATGLLTMNIDDGAVAYINGVKVVTYNMPTNASVPITGSTLSSTLRLRVTAPAARAMSFSRLVCVRSQVLVRQGRGRVPAVHDSCRSAGGGHERGCRGGAPVRCDVVGRSIRRAAHIQCAQCADAEPDQVPERDCIIIAGPVVHSHRVAVVRSVALQHAAAVAITVAVPHRLLDGVGQRVVRALAQHVSNPDRVVVSAGHRVAICHSVSHCQRVDNQDRDRVDVGERVAVGFRVSISVGVDIQVTQRLRVRVT